jgi:hypothetical protein
MMPNRFLAFTIAFCLAGALLCQTFIGKALDKIEASLNNAPAVIHRNLK